MERHAQNGQGGFPTPLPFLRENNLLNPNDELDLVALHYVFIPRINENLEKFKVSWNNHNLSIEKKKTPNQLYTLGMLNLFGSGLDD